MVNPPTTTSMPAWSGSRASSLFSLGERRRVRSEWDVRSPPLPSSPLTQRAMAATVSDVESKATEALVHDDFKFCTQDCVASPTTGTPDHDFLHLYIFPRAVEPHHLLPTLLLRSHCRAATSLHSWDQILPRLPL